MRFEFKCTPKGADDRCFWVAESLKCNGAVGQGATLSKAIQELEENEKTWVQMYKEDVDKTLYDAYHFEDSVIDEFTDDEIIETAIRNELSEKECAFCCYVLIRGNAMK